MGGTQHTALQLWGFGMALLLMTLASNADKHMPLLASMSGLHIGALSSAKAAGALAATAPGGLLVQAIGPHRAMLAAAASLAACAAAGAAAILPGSAPPSDSPPSLRVLLASRAACGASFALYSLAQQALIRQRLPAGVRGRALSAVGGAFRLGALLGPLAAAQLGSRPHAILLAASLLSSLAAALQAALLLLSPLPPLAHRSRIAPSPAPGRSLLRGYLRAHWRRLAAAWVATALLSLTRASKDLLLPLAAAAAGSAPRGASLSSLASAGDSALFWLGGVLLDGVGPASAGAASLCVMSAGFACLLAGRLTAAELGLGLGNALASGSVMALGAALAPSLLAPSVLGLFHTGSSLGSVGGPVLVGALVQRLGLRLGLVAAVACALAGAVWWGCVVVVIDDDGRAAAAGTAPVAVVRPRRAASSDCGEKSRQRRGNRRSTTSGSVVVGHDDEHDDNNDRDKRKKAE